MPLERKILMLDSKGSIYDAPFQEHGMLKHNANYLEDSDLVVFTGGHDVDPSLYGDDIHPTSSISEQRDKREQAIFTQAYIMAIPMVGICRGAQFLNVMNNGRLLQNVNNHGIMGTHPITTQDGDTIHVTSTHHQMMIPSEGDVLAWASGVATVFEAGGSLSPQELLNPYQMGNGMYAEPEVVYWPRTNSLGVQYHPEYMNPDSDGWLYFQNLLNKYIFKLD